MPRRKARISKEEDENSSKLIPDGWELVVKSSTNGSKKTWYQCSETGQMVHKYEDLMRYVKYAKEAKVSIYSPHFPEFRTWQKKRKAKLPAGNDFWAKWPEVPAPDQVGSLKFAVHWPGRISRLPDFCWGAGGGKHGLEKHPGFKESDCAEKEGGPSKDGSEYNCQHEEEGPSKDDSESECPEEEEGPNKDGSESNYLQEEEIPGEDGSESDCPTEEENRGEDGTDFETESVSQMMGRETKWPRSQENNDVAPAEGQEIQDLGEMKKQQKGKKVVSGQEASIEEGSDADAKRGSQWNEFKTKRAHIQDSSNVGQLRDPEEIKYEKKGKKVISYQEDSSEEVMDFEAKFLSCWPGIRTKGVVVRERNDEATPIRQINPENQFVVRPLGFNGKELCIQERNNEFAAIRLTNPQNQFAEKPQDTKEMKSEEDVSRELAEFEAEIASYWNGKATGF